MTKDARFYFANLGADVVRCIKAAQTGDEKRYQESLGRARTTLKHIREAHRPEAYEEGLLLVRELTYARRAGTLERFDTHVNALMLSMIPPVTH